MRIRPREEVERAWREWWRERDRGTPRPPIFNAETTATLLDTRELRFRGRGYSVPPVPWPLAVQLHQCQEEMRDYARLSAPEVRALFHRTITLIHRAVRPNGFLRRLTWRFTPSPFCGASPWEVGELLGFSLVCAMTPQGWSGKHRAEPGTSRTTSSASSTPARRGSVPTGSRSRGGTS